MSIKNYRRISVLVSSQTLYHLENMAQFCGHKDLGRVIDKLVREKRIDQNESINTSINTGVRNYATSQHQTRRSNR